MNPTNFLQNIQSGDETTIETLVRTHQRTVFQLALSILDSDNSQTSSEAAIAEAEKATRQTFLTAIDRLARYQEEKSFETWLYQITVEISLRRLRFWQLRRSIFGFISRKSVSPAHASVNSLPGDASLWKTVRGLPIKLRLPVVLRYYHDFSIKQIASILRVSEGAVHARLDQAREKITQ